jgi:archaellum component FlaF (FlaF/FlaG flagellin family)
MKSILVLFTLFLSFTSQAAPVAGDMVRYRMTTSMGPVNQVMEQKIEVTSVNANAGTYTTKITITYNGTQVGQSTETADLNSATESESTLDHCSEMPADMASIETITVPAGTFKVCHITTQQSGVKLDQYMGRVLFGLVKSVTVESMSGTTTTFELMEIVKN